MKNFQLENRRLAFAAALVLTVVLFAFQNRASTHRVSQKAGMIKVTILYPNGDGKTFDMAYYAGKHMPLVASLLGDSLKTFEIDKGISGRTGAEPPQYLAIGYLYFERLSAFRNAFGPNAEKIRSDIPNFTNIQPVVQISEVVR